MAASESSSSSELPDTWGVTEFLHFVVNKEKAPSIDVKLAVLQVIV